MTVAAPRYRRLGHDQRRAQILDAARRLFSKQHYAAVSSDEIAREAGVTRGLLYHYFGSKRELFVEVVRDSLGAAQAIVPQIPRAGRLRDVVARSVDLWLDVVEANAETMFAVLGAEGFGRDAELEGLVHEGRDAGVEAIIAVLGIEDADERTRAVLRAYSGLADVAVREWLQRRTLTRAQVHALLARTLHALVADVAPAVSRA
jgi:AcrR family transcriptional regulator